MNNQQIDAAVHGALGFSPITLPRAYGDGRYLYPAYTTDPRLWWPLAEEAKLHLIPHAFVDGLKWGCGWLREYKGQEAGKHGKFEWLTDAIRESHAGRAVCLAYLKMKGVKVNG